MWDRVNDACDDDDHYACVDDDEDGCMAEAAYKIICARLILFLMYLL